MSEKEKFVKAFEAIAGKSPKEYHKSKDYKEFALVMNANPVLPLLFRAAVEECTGADNCAAGLGTLFDMPPP